MKSNPVSEGLLVQPHYQRDEKKLVQKQFGGRYIKILALQNPRGVH